MKQEDIINSITDVETSVQLKELGLHQDTMFAWKISLNTDDDGKRYNDISLKTVISCQSPWYDDTDVFEGLWSNYGDRYEVYHSAYLMHELFDICNNKGWFTPKDNEPYIKYQVENNTATLIYTDERGNIVNVSGYLGSILVRGLSSGILKL